MKHASLIFLLMISASVSAEVANDVFQLEKSSKLFAAKIYQILGKSPKNVLISPYSVQTVMALAQTGARGTTLEQMSSVLALPKNNTILEHLFTTLHESLCNTKDVALNIANKVYVRDDIKLSSEFKKSANAFESEFGVFDVIEPEKVAAEMNEWVEQKTNNNIKDIIKADYIEADTAILLINALYFKGRWAIPFEPLLTRKADFFLTSNQTVKVDMMHTVGNHNVSYNDELNVKYLYLQYSDPNFELVVILPNEIEGIKNLTQNIDKILETQPIVYEKEVEVWLPKFIMDNEIQFREVFEKLGMTEPFSNADFRGLTEYEKPLMIKKIVQKTFLEVNEEGTEGAAASASFLADRIFNERRSQFLVDHPFLFTLRYKPTGTILFLGHYTSISD